LYRKKNKEITSDSDDNDSDSTSDSDERKNKPQFINKLQQIKKKKNIDDEKLEKKKKKKKREIKKYFERNKDKYYEDAGIDDFSHLDLDQEQEYDLQCKF
jgi:hypothetical protein